MISVILPTYNRASILKMSLERLSAQKGVAFEVIVVDDGSSDHTKAVVQAFENKKRKWNKLHYLHQANAGQAVARNRGVKQAQGNLILFFQDDTFAMEDTFLKQHVQAHKKNPSENVAVLGYSTWDPALAINDYMLFLETGWQFNYPALKRGFVAHPEPYKFFYTSNLSLKKSFFKKEGFNETFRGYGWEDMELGYRLWKNHGMKLFYEPEAAAHHHHPIPEADLPKKMQKVGQSALYFQALHSELVIVPQGWKRVLIFLATFKVPVFLAKKLSKKLYFKLASWDSFFAGVKGKKVD